jgi:hypothetical protein
MRPFQMHGDLRQGDVRNILYQPEDLFGMGLNAMRAIIAALTMRTDRTRLPPPGHPVDRRRCRNSKTFRRRAPRHTAFNRRYQPFP